MKHAVQIREERERKGGESVGRRERTREDRPRPCGQQVHRTIAERENESTLRGKGKERTAIDWYTMDDDDA